MQNRTNRPDALCYVRGHGKMHGLTGEVRFYQRQNGVIVSADVKGLPAENESGFFGFHIHEGGSCLGEGYSETGGHLNPHGKPHPQHTGDLPPLLSCAGRAHMQVLTNRFSVSDVIGRTIVIHSRADDFHSQPAGNAGDKIACGIIRQK